ncbi:hypothetical protein [Photobacterium leiognathi]|uniref:hypothetical protein n=1 Tax=Photobacterium leiognathi TaxID=553611 RepID=UPI002981A9B1|nr:hypothetical protein [Photobacterium leiognathi]
MLDDSDNCDTEGGCYCNCHVNNDAQIESTLVESISTDSAIQCESVTDLIHGCGSAELQLGVVPVDAENPPNPWDDAYVEVTFVATDHWCEKWFGGGDEGGGATGGPNKGIDCTKVPVPYLGPNHPYDDKELEDVECPAPLLIKVDNQNELREVLSAQYEHIYGQEWGFGGECKGTAKIKSQ